jgi:endonuclease/exonuclease/phosphatase (EEP) superfamily protein YafD
MRPALIRILVFGTAITCLASLLAFLGRWLWACELLVNFRTHYALLFVVALCATLALRAWRVVALAAAGLALNVAAMASQFAGGESAGNEARRPVRVVSFNVNVGNGDMAGVARYLESLAADVVVLEEMTPANAQRLAASLPQMPHQYPGPDDPATDVRILSRWPLAESKLVFLGGAMPVARVDVHLGDHRLRVFGMHLNWPLLPRAAQARNEQLVALARELAQCQGACVAVGDFNTTPWSSHYRRLLADSGFKDCASGRGWLPTWPATLPAVLRIRIDHCLASARVGVNDVRVGEGAGSDHLATINDLSIGPGAIDP